MKYYPLLARAAVFPLLMLSISFGQIQKGAYHTYDEMTTSLSRLVGNHRNIASMESLGKTLEKRDIWVVKIGGKDADQRPALLVVGGAEANYIIGSELTLRFTEYLLTSYGKVDSITQLVNSTTFYILPRVNPDASEAFFRKPLYERTFNARPIDDDKDGRVDEDGYEDLNVDGLITMMRVRDDRGEWMIHLEDSRIMKKADPSKKERGEYKLFSEGLDNDKDERWNEDEVGGVDFNRNFPHNYSFFSLGSGPHQISEEESRAVANFAFSHPNIAVVFTFSSNDNLMNPWKREKPKGPSAEEDAPSRFVTSVMEDDEEYFNFVSKHYQEITSRKGAPRSTKGEGAFSEWAYYHFGRWSFAAYPWWMPEIEAQRDTGKADTLDQKKADIRKEKAPDEKPDPSAEQLKALKWIDRHGIRGGFVEWSAVKHPDFPDRLVEVGGFRPYVMTNPPVDSIEQISASHNAFLTSLAMKRAVVQIRNVIVEPTGDRVFRLTATIANVGYFPTNSAMGAKAGWPQNVKVTLTLSKNHSLASGKLVTILEPIKGSGGWKELSWVIVAKKGDTVTLEAASPMAGKSTQTVTLK